MASPKILEHNGYFLFARKLFSADEKKNSANLWSQPSGSEKKNINIKFGLSNPTYLDNNNKVRLTFKNIKQFYAIACATKYS